MAGGVETTDPLETGSHDLPVSSELETYLLSGWGDSTAPAVQPLAPPELCAARRARLRSALPDGPIVVAAERDLVYLTGHRSEGAVLVLGDDATLYVEPPSRRDSLRFYDDYERGELWVGARPSLDDIANALGLEVRPRSELSAAVEESRLLKAVLSELRLVKDPWEIAQIEAAIEVTIRGFEDVGLALRDHADERLVETVFAARARRDANGVSFPPIAAGGAHATTLHWWRNDSPLSAGDLLLLDAGAESYTLYAADLTRTYPVSGTFTDAQRRVVELLNDAQDAALAAIAPGRSYRDFRYAIAEVMTAGLPALGIRTDGLPEDFYRRFTICGPGHMLGLDVHDCHHARASTYLDGVLEPGHVLTVEPGLYFQANDLTIPEELRGIGVRVEDDVVVTEEGIRNLSASLPRRAAEIEGWLASL